MSKLIPVSILLALALALAVSALPSAMTFFHLDVQPNVGWNRGGMSYSPAADVAFVLPGVKPCIGWNT